jgi:hypothetical protein
MMDTRGSFSSPCEQGLVSNRTNQRAHSYLVHPVLQVAKVSRVLGRVPVLLNERTVLSDGSLRIVRGPRSGRGV